MAAVPFQPCEPAAPGVLHLLLAPLDQLSADGQLRELITERREHLGVRAAAQRCPARQTRPLELFTMSQE